MVESSPRRTWRAMRSGIASSFETGRAQVTTWRGKRAARRRSAIPPAAAHRRSAFMVRGVSPNVRRRTTVPPAFDHDGGPGYAGGMIARRTVVALLPPEIEHSILQQRSVDRAQAYLAELRGKAQVVVSLPQPRNEVQIPADARALGPEKAPVTIVEFSDYLCPFCQKAQSVVDEVLARNKGKVRFVHRDFLLGRPRSMAVARAAQCAADQGKFWDYRRNLLEAPGDWTDEDLLRRTASLGLDRAGLQACLSSDRHDKAILDSSEEGKALGVQSTPTFFINGRRLRGVRSADQFQEIIDSELGVRPGQS